MDQQNCFSPKSSSPRRIDSSTGTLKTKISLGQKYPQIINSGPFYLVKEPPEKNKLTASTNMLQYYGLEHTYNKFNSKKVKEQLSSFLPTLPCVIDGPGVIDNSSLRSVIDKPPICGKELLALSSVQLAGFRLHPNVPLPEKYRILNSTPTRKHKKKDKKHKYDNNIVQDISASGDQPDIHSEKKHKKGKRHDDDKERKKRKKEKKRKKQSKHSPDHPSSISETP
jgi:mediator of RNA polymerase II transcription subunit 19